MPSTTARRPLPALVALVVLLVLTGIVWWRVLNRSTATQPSAKPCPTPTVTVHLPAAQSVTVVVLNATKRKGIATKVRSTLVEDGFNIPDLAGNDRKYLNKVKGVAQIRYGTAGAQGAALLRYYFPGAQVTAQSTIKSAAVVVSLGAAYRAVAAPAAVQKALDRDKAVAGTPTPTPGSTCGT